MKRLLKLALLFVMMLCLCGCDFLTFSVEELLSSPIIADEQTAIYQALIAQTGKEVFFEYPRSGSYRSAFVMTDVDQEAGDEALVFYSLSSSQDEDVRLSILDRDENGDWISMFEIQGAGNTVDKVLINRVGNNTDIIVGYGTRGYEGSQVIIYRYYMGALAVIYEGNYSALELYDLDGCGEEEIIIVSKTGAQSSATVIQSADGISYFTHEAALSSNAVSIEGHAIGQLETGESVLYVDVLDESGYISTELIYLRDDTLICPTSSIAGLREYTARPLGYLSVDYDGDSDVEVPVTEPFIGYASGSRGTVQLMTKWYSYDADQLCYVKKSNAYYNITDGYVFTLPNRWLNVVTASRSEDGVVTFLKYDSSAETMEDMKPIMSFTSLSAYADSSSLIDDGYTELVSTDFKRYFVKILADESEPLVLTNDEIKDNFYGIDR